MTVAVRVGATKTLNPGGCLGVCNQVAVSTDG